MTAAPGPPASTRMHLLDGNVLVALVDQAHVHHAAAQDWFANLAQQKGGGFATCPITQGTLLRLTMHVGGQTIEQALAVLAAVTQHPLHQFWPDSLGYGPIRWYGVSGHRQVTDAYLAALARHHGGKLVSFDKGLVALHPDVGLALQA